MAVLKVSASPLMPCLLRPEAVFAIIGCSTIVTQMVCIPCWQWLTSRNGKYNAYLIQTLLLMIVTGGKYFTARHQVRARSHCHFVPPLIHFIPYLLRDSAPLFLKRNCHQTLHQVWTSVMTMTLWSAVSSGSQVIHHSLMADVIEYDTMLTGQRREAQVRKTPTSCHFLTRRQLAVTTSCHFRTRK
jgi:Na+/melibiose symporter-like transporter